MQDNNAKSPVLLRKYRALFVLKLNFDLIKNGENGVN